MTLKKPLSAHDVRGALAKVKMLILLLAEPDAIPETQRNEVLKSVQDALRILKKV